MKALAESGLSILNLSLHNLREVDRQLETLRYAKTLGIIPILATVVTKVTIAKLPDIMRETNRQGVLYRYIPMQSIGGSFSARADGLCPNPDELASFVALVQDQKKRMHLVANTSKYMEEGTEVYPKGWHCDSHTDRWVSVDNEGKLMACNEYRTQVSVLEIPSLRDPRWGEARTLQREGCAGCTYECHMNAERMTRLTLVGEGVDKAKSMLFAG